jgi:hypothetical protein
MQILSKLQVKKNKKKKEDNKKRKKKRDKDWKTTLTSIK